MKVQFLLGPAGSGKTFECLAQVRAALSASAEGPPLLFLAPKQATFQLERQLLADAALPGYTRLKILSFERLAQFVLEESLGQEPALLSAEGRLMVLRALLFRKQNDLKLFRSTARLSGFVEELSGVLRIFQQHEIAPAKLRALLENGRLPPELHAKLHDFSLLLHAYLDWLSKHEIQDEACLLDCATALLRGLHPGLEPSATTTPADQLVPLAAPARKRHTKRRHKASADSESQLMLFDNRSHRPARESSVEAARPHGPWLSPLANLHFAGLWLDGFAEMSSQEIALLSALVPLCDSATLAFCLDAEPAEEPAWLSTWAIIGQTCRRVYHQLAAVQSIEVETRILPRVQEQNRFSGALPLAHLEQFWIEPRPFISDGNEPLSATIRAVLCRNPEAECVLAAREILRHVQAGGRFRDVAVLVRKLDAYADSLRRIFTGYGIPFFLDQRESAAHHPLAELTRYTLRTLAFGWEREDWFGALKTGLLPVRDEEIDRLENIALERGWSGQVWLDPLVTPDDPDLGPSLESLRQTLVGPFQSLAKHLGRSQWPHAQNASEESPIPKRLHPTGQQVADGLRAFWEMLCVENTLQAWADTASAPTARAPDDKSQIQRPQLRHLIHETVWTEMNRWIDNVALAFSDLELPLREWLPILEAGLSHLSIGVIPPALDQVLIGAIDRSRQPDLQFAIVLGMNESVFPAPPPQETLLTDRDRAALEANQIYLGPGLRHRLGHERFYAYIALTRARRRLLLTASRFDFDDRSINPSPILDHLKRMFPEMQLEEIDAQPSPGEWFHPIEVLPLLLRARIHGRLEDTSAAWASFANVPGVKDFLERFKSRGTAASDEHLAPGIAEQLFGPHDLQTSVSRIEQFAACPFRFFVNSGLRVEERIQFEIDARERGSFQHEVLARFHTELQSEKRKWRDLQPAEARARIGQIAETIAAEYRLGLFLSTRENIFTMRSLTESLQSFVESIIHWMHAAYDFNPAAVEVAFGTEHDPHGPWILPLDDAHRMLFRGKIDRIDLAVDAASGQIWCVVIDYKSRSRRIDPVLMTNGVQIQLPSYLAVVCQLESLKQTLGVESLLPAGVFYVSLRGEFKGGKNRAEVLADADQVRKKAFAHSGRFNLGALSLLDRQAGNGGSGQFSYRVTAKGRPDKKFADLLDPDRFEEMLRLVEQRLKEMGRRIFQGQIAIDPYLKGQTACQHCDYQSICRIDPWTHQFRVLKKEA